MGIKKMKIHIGQNGHTEIQVEGGQYGNCLAFTQAIEQALGKVEQRELTEDCQALDPLAVPTRERLNEAL
ncbi:conserved hypothetical protein [Gammaproteobacteria bacterium]